jgi:hypothetical protein
LLEKLDENKNCRNHRLSSEKTVNWIGRITYTMAGNPNAIQLCCPVPVIVVNQALKVIPLGVCR